MSVPMEHVSEMAHGQVNGHGPMTSRDPEGQGRHPDMFKA